MCEQRLVKQLAPERFREYLMLAHTHDAKSLKKACFMFAKGNPAVIMQSDVVSIATENLQLWTEMQQFFTTAAPKRSASSNPKGEKDSKLQARE